MHFRYDATRITHHMVEVPISPRQELLLAGPVSLTSRLSRQLLRFFLSYLLSYSMLPPISGIPRFLWGVFVGIATLFVDNKREHEGENCSEVIGGNPRSLHYLAHFG